MKHVMFVAMAGLALAGCHKTKTPLDPEAQKPEICKILVDQIVDGKRVLEINNVKVEDYSPRRQPGESVTCTGDAITSEGNKMIEFGLIQTPQGNPLVSTRFP